MANSEFQSVKLSHDWSLKNPDIVGKPISFFEEFWNPDPDYVA